MRDALALTGLDRVFAFPLVPAEAAAPAPALAGVVRRAALAAVAGARRRLPAIAAGPPPTDPAAILARVIERNPSLSVLPGPAARRPAADLVPVPPPAPRRDDLLQAALELRGRLRPACRATRKGFDKLFTDVGDPSSWEKRFVVTLDGRARVQRPQDIALRLVQRVRGMIDHETVLVDPATWTIDQIRYDYYNGGTSR